MDKGTLKTVLLLILSLLMVVFTYLLMTKGWGVEVESWPWLIGCFLSVSIISTLLGFVKQS